MGHESKNFIVENYGRKSEFASFLPGIGGVKGIPIWCNYVNRGQAVVSFGVEDKDHAIMEFYPAHQAYQNVSRTGFRTFLRVDGVYGEAFGNVELPHRMVIGRNFLKISEENEDFGIQTQVTYFTLPSERIGGLVRKVMLTNAGKETKRVEALDGMPALIPYGISNSALKNIGQTIKAWMQVEDVETGAPYFKARFSADDSAMVSEIKGGNFALAIDGSGERLRAVVDPDAVFAYDTSLQIAKQFEREGLEGVYGRSWAISDQYPCSFFGVDRKLEPGEQIVLYELIGQVEDRRALKRFLEKEICAEYFEQKFAEAVRLTEELCRVIETSTADADFDEYCSYTYMDNVLRGGYPLVLPGDHIFYVYGRKHGDLERDYNYFRMLPEFYSQGNGNFRDVNQNRRMDIFFTPYVGRENIKKFYSLIQLDGYNPLSIEQVTYTLSEEAVEEIFDACSQEQKEDLMVYLTAPFTPGGFYGKLGELGICDEARSDAYFAQVMEKAQSTLNAEFGEGYWSDHWTYNLDLIESYLAIYPERESELLMEQDYTYFASQIPILPRRKRYVNADNGVRQYRFLDESRRRTDGERQVRAQFGQGRVVKVSLLEKLLVLNATKYAALDAYGMGVEMEGGKPGWYDALNGLPGLFGSSMAESYELARNIRYTLGALGKCPAYIAVTEEVADYLLALDALTDTYRSEIEDGEELLDFWNERNELKEAYERRTFQGISGVKTTLENERLQKILRGMLDVVHAGIQKALRLAGGAVPTYFTYELERYAEDGEGLVPLHFAPGRVPAFLEGAVRYLKLELTAERKREVYEQVRAGELYDAKLGMYKVNASLADASYELGRAKAFTPGWLENESIWLHMEYKYLLELLKSGLYREFLEDLERAAIPFLDSEVYGRSIYENSSFIASSSNPNTSCHGKGYVARLSGSTVEFLQIWQMMMFGSRPFLVEGGELTLRFWPTLPARLVGEARSVEAMFMGGTRVAYRFAVCKDHIPGAYRTEEIRLRYRDGRTYCAQKDVLRGQVASDVREGRVTDIEIFLK